tara:strand:- start:346 stop:594 length:249 start_codon:yes stop_codon:yes gene_type:complete
MRTGLKDSLKFIAMYVSIANRIEERCIGVQRVFSREMIIKNLLSRLRMTRALMTKDIGKTIQSEELFMAIKQMLRREVFLLN